MAKKKTVGTEPHQKKAGPVSLHPLTFDEALRGLLKAKPRERSREGPKRRAVDKKP